MYSVFYQYELSYNQFMYFEGKMSTKKSIGTDNNISVYYTFLLGSLLGLLLFLLIYGVKVLVPTYDAWLFNGRNKEDLMQHYMGWMFYRKSSWSFPIGKIDDYCYPEGVPIIYSDSVPLFAVIFKIFSAVLPSTFQYFGIWGLLCMTLSGGFSALCVRHFTKDTAYSVICSVFFSCSLVLLHKMFWHCALSAHWIVLASLYIWLEKDKKWSVVKSAVYWSLLSVLSISIQAYFVPMVWGIMLCSLLDRMAVSKEYKSCLFRILIVVASSAFASVLAGYVWGYFSGAMPNVGEIYGIFCFNFNSFFNTYGHSAFFPGLKYHYVTQYESYCYLGLGMFIVLAAVVIVAFVRSYNSKTDIKLNMRHAVFTLFVIGFVFFASCPEFSIGDLYIPYGLPKSVLKILSVFRTNGRFIWPVYYMLLIVLLGKFYELFSKKKYVFVAVFLVLAVQMYESGFYMFSVGKYYQQTFTYECPLKSSEWDKFSGYTRIVFYPDIAEFYDGLEIRREALEVQYYAYQHDMNLNTVYLARDNSSKINAEVYELFSSGDYKNEKDTLFVFLDEIPEDTDLYFYEIDGFTVGTVDPVE